jgi:2-methylcitrate dehydratase
VDVRLLVVEVACRAGRVAPRPAAGDAARETLWSALARLLHGLRDPSLAALAGPPVPGATLPLGARVPGTSLEVEPATAAAILGALLHGAAPGPVDHVAPLLAAADYAARRAHYDGVAPPRVVDLLEALEDVAALCVALRTGPGAGTATTDVWFAPRVAGAIVAARLLGADEAGQRTAALGAALDGSPPAAGTLAAVHGSGPALEWQLRRAAGENAARALRHALAARRAPVDGSGFAVVGLPAAADAPSAGARQPTPSDEGAAFGDFAAAVRAAFPERQAHGILVTCSDGAFTALAVDAWVAGLVRN